MVRTDIARSPGFKFGLAIFIGFVLTIPLFSVWLLVYDRQSQSQEASASITAGWGGSQTIDQPVLVIPYTAAATETVVQNGQSVTRTNEVRQELTLAPEVADISTDVAPEVRKRSIYEAVVYDARIAGRARFAFPDDLAHNVDPAKLDLSHAELRFGISDPRGLGADPRVTLAGKAIRLEAGNGNDGGRGFFGRVDATGLQSKPLMLDFDLHVRGNGALALEPSAGETRWSVRSNWPSPSFGGDFLPSQPTVTGKGFAATYRIGNLALGRSLVSIADAGSAASEATDSTNPAERASALGASISFIQPVDLYSQVNRATKYGFLFIGFTFIMLLMFDVIGGVPVSAVEYLLTGAALVLFFVLLLAFAEIIGFLAAYVVASAAIVGLNTAYSAAVLDSWQRAGLVGGLLVALYTVLYVLLSLEAFSLLIGSLLLFIALAGVMYATRSVDWGRVSAEPQPS